MSRKRVGDVDVDVDVVVSEEILAMLITRQPLSPLSMRRFQGGAFLRTSSLALGFTLRKFLDLDCKAQRGEP